jgi:predicted RNA methylase
MLSGYKTMCDIGCGLGLVDLELYSMMERIDCVDINEAVIGKLKQSVEVRGIENIHARLEDVYNLSGSWDVIYMSFFGSRELEKFLPLCKKLIAVVGKEAESELFPGKYRKMKKNTAEDTEKYLIENNIEYKITHREFEFGQPFKSMEEAASFVRSLSKEATDSEINEFLERRLTEITHPEYRFFMPRKKPIGIFQLKGLL